MLIYDTDINFKKETLKNVGSALYRDLKDPALSQKLNKESFQAPCQALKHIKTLSVSNLVAERSSPLNIHLF